MIGKNKIEHKERAQTISFYSTNNKSNEITHTLPKYKIHTYLKTHLWECFPELPKINIELMKNILKSI